ncbi:MAG: glycosyltransferase family 39 protein, partial [Bacteroidota bacterium]
MLPDADNCQQSPIAETCSTPEPRFFIAPWHFSAFFCALMLVVGLTGYGLLDPDEGRYAEIPREMIELRDFVTPRLNYVPYLEKPPLLYWATAGAFMLFGDDPLVLRLVPAICGILGMLVAWWLTLLCFGKYSARWAPSIIATSVVYFVVARIPIIDTMFSMLLAAALTAWLAGEHRQGSRRYAMWIISGLLLGGALLAKGPVAVVLFGAIVVGYLLWTRRPLMIFAAAGLPVLLSVAVFLPWVFAIQRATPEFYHYFFIVQHVQRFLGNGIPEHVQPFYYYIVVLPLGFMLWSFYWPGMVRGALRHKWTDLPPAFRRDTVFLIIWFVVIMVFFSASSCKLAQYILPAWWPISAVMAAWLRREFCISNPRRRLYVPTTLTAVFVALMMAGMIIYAGRQDLIPALMLQRPLLIFVICGVISFGLLMFTSWLSNRHWSIAQLAIGAILPFAGMLPAMHVITSVKDMNGLIPP